MQGRPLFSIAGIPVWVSPWHFLLIGVLFFDFLQRDVAFGVGVMVLASFSVLMHEVGHGLTSLFFGLSPRVQLTGMGGVCFHEPARRPRDEFLITAAGPAMNFALAGAFALARPLADGMLTQLLGLAAVINVVWGIYNLLPILPLDGGVLLAIIAQKVRPGVRGVRFVHWVGLILAVIVGLYGIASGFGMFMAVLAGFLALHNWGGLKQTEHAPERELYERHDDVRDLLAEARAAFTGGQLDEAARLAHQARALHRVSRDEMDHIWQILALVAARKGEYGDALRHALRVPDSPEMAQVAAVSIVALDDVDAARDFLDRPGATLIAPEQLEAVRTVIRAAEDAHAA
jgi:Zn-dependent protease